MAKQKMTISIKMIKDLSSACESLANAIGGFFVDDECKNHKEKIYRALRKLSIAAAAMERGNIICVTGHQGAGKTTLIKNLYGLDKSMLNIALNRSEKIPVFISEKRNCSKPIMKKYYYGEASQSIESCEISDKEFIAASKGDTDGENGRVMYLELCLPYKVFNNEHSSFMLLPGYEKRNDYWQGLIDFSMACSDTAIAVFDGTNYSDGGNEKVLNKIKEKFSDKSDNIIYVISHGDQKDDDYNERVKSNFIKTMEIDNEDRVIFSGSYTSEEKNKKWIDSLKSAIEKYCNASSVAEKNCGEYILSVIDDEISPSLNALKEAIEKDGVTQILTNLNNSNILDEYQKIVDKKRKSLEELLGNELERAEEQSERRLGEIFDENKSVLGGVRKVIFGENRKDLEKTKEMLKDSLKMFPQGQEGYVYYSQRALVEAASKSIEDYAGRSEKDNIFKNLLEDKNNGQNAKGNQLAIADNAGTQLAVKDNENAMAVLNDAKILLLGPDNGEEFKRGSYKDALKCIVDMETYLFSKGIQDSFASPALYKDVDLDSANSEMLNLENIRNSIVKGGEEVNKMTATTKSMLAGLGIAAVDVIPDGTFNLVSSLAAALHLPAGVAFGAVGALAAGIMATSVIRDSNRVEIANYQSCCSCLEKVYYNIKNEYLSRYDMFTDELKEKIENNLLEISNVNDSVKRTYNAGFSIYRIEKTLDLIRREINGGLYDLDNLWN